VRWKHSELRVGPVATPRTFSTKHHIGNLALVPHGGEDGPVGPGAVVRALRKATSSIATVSATRDWPHHSHSSESGDPVSLKNVIDSASPGRQP